jgi:ferritin-like metal-binding protein YciE
MQAKNLTELLAHEIQDLYSAEDQILEALPDMIENARDADLQAVLREHYDQTRHHKSRLETVAEELEVKLDGSKCKGMVGIIKEGADLIRKQDDEDVRDAAIIASAQRVEHYEMAAYGTAAHFATALGLSRVAQQLNQTLQEEKVVDKTLSRIADGRVNERAIEAR